jgi:hypothetical protein
MGSQNPSAPMINASRVWIPHNDRCHRSPFAASVDRALLVMFPPLWEEELPTRMAAALEALGECSDLRRNVADLIAPTAEFHS